MEHDLQTKLEAMIRVVHDAQVQIDQENVADLSSLERDVGALCTCMSTTSPADARELQPLMAEMIAALDDLAKSLQRLKEKQAKG